MDCREVHNYVDAYLDGEFAEEERVDFASHIYLCPECREKVDVEQRFRRKLRESAQLRSTTAPPELRARIIHALDGCDRHEKKAWRWVCRLVPATVATLLIAGSWVSQEKVLGSTAATLAPLAEQSILWHRKRLPFDVRGPQIEQVRQYFRDKLPFAVRLPHFTDRQVRLIGARLTNLRGSPAAYVVYRVGPERLSVFVMGEEMVPLFRRNQKYHVHAANGYNVAMYASGSTAYAVTSEIERNRLTQLVADLR